MANQFTKAPNSKVFIKDSSYTNRTKLKKRKLDQESGGEEPIEAEGSIIFDRNELLKRIANSDK